MDEKMLVRVVHERPALNVEQLAKDSSWRVIRWSFVMFPGVILIVTTWGIRYSDLMTVIIMVIGFTLASGGLWGCMVSIASFYKVRDQTIYTERQYWPSSVMPGQVRIERREDNRILLGKYKLSPADLDSLAQVLHKNDWRFVRDVVREAAVFSGISKARVWADVREEFERLGIVKDRVVLPEHRDLFVSYSPTLAHLLSDY